MADEQVVLRYRDGRTERVVLEPIDLHTEVLQVRRLDDRGTTDVPFSLLKAVFFAKGAHGSGASDPGRSMITVEFTDGEIIRGRATYNPERNGFFLYPEDRSKNERIFVVNSAIVSIEVEKL